MALDTINAVSGGSFQDLSTFVLLDDRTGEQAVGYRVSLWGTANAGDFPGAGAACSAGVAGESCTASMQGALGIPLLGSGKVARISRLSVSPTGAIAVGASCLLIDRLWQNSGLVSSTTTAQTVNSATWPARDGNGSTNGDRVQIALESLGSQSLSANSTATISYTNQAGTSGRTGTISQNVSNSVGANGHFYPFRLEGTDTGVRSVQSITLNASLGAGKAIQLVAFRPLAMFPLLPPAQGVKPRVFDTLDFPFKIYPDSCLTVLHNCNATGAAIDIQWAVG